jgi:hypothetical protein
VAGADIAEFAGFSVEEGVHCAQGKTSYLILSKT